MAVQLPGDQGTDFFGDPNLLGVRWWQQLFTDPDFWQAWIDRWTDLRRGMLSNSHVFAAVDTLSAQVRKAQPRELQRWNGTGSSTTPRSGTVSGNGIHTLFPVQYQGEIDFLKKWLADRGEFFDTNCLRAPVFNSNGGAITSGFTLTITAPTIESNTTIYYTTNGTDPRLPGGAISPAARSAVSPLLLTFTNNVKIFARNFNLSHSNVTGGAVGG